MRPVLIILAAVAAVAPSGASARAEPPSVRVAYGDLDLSTQSGRAHFDRRIAAAVRRVCPAGSVRDLLRSQISRRCLAETRARTAERVVAAMASRTVAASSATLAATGTMAP